MKIAVEITPQQLADIMTTVAESSAVTYWCSAMKPAKRSRFQKRAEAMPGPWYASPDAYGDDFLIDVTEIDGIGGAQDHRVNGGRLRAGLALMAEKHGRHFGDLLADNSDSITADVFLQCVALGEVRYG